MGIVEEVGLDASDKEKVLVDLINAKKQLSASAHGNVAAAETSDGQRAQVQRFGDRGGLAQIEGHKAQLKTKENEEGKHALLKADNEYELDTVARGSLKDPKDSEFEANNKRFDFKLKPNSQTKSEGEGTIAYNDKEKGKSGRYAYTIRQDGKKTDATLSAHDIGDKDEFAQSLFGRRSEKYHCTGQLPL
ncbi:hypothetical protein Tcan_08060 [Toxocara canis]|uniref:Uncharacterized protein n=1 Tax=Toxocara canis TaxID=6265 RepID=A0A0B2V8B1_TOXCA|nr:hypothetical protein Tcan_08060 [Toxocara canis]